MVKLLPPLEFIAPSDSRRSAKIALRYRNAALILGLAVFLLAGTATYLVARDRAQIWSTARQNQQDVAEAMQSWITMLLTQSVFSLRGVSEDMRSGPPQSRATALDALHQAKRFDPISAYLGIKTAHDFLLVGPDGEPSLAGFPSDFDFYCCDSTADIHLGALTRLKRDNTWYLPVVLDAPQVGEHGVIFALIASDRLLGGASSLKVLPGSFATLFTKDGRRLLRYLIAEDALEPNGKPVPAAVIEQVRTATNGSFERKSTVDGRPTLFGYSASSDLPLVVSTGVAESTLNKQWRAKAFAPAVVLAAGILFIVVFGVRLRGTLREHGDYVATQVYMATHDQLTRLPNRYAFLQYVDKLIAESSSDRAFWVLVLDLNRFKEVNDTLGHAAGDALLLALGVRLNALMAKSPGIVARLGGDELAICMPQMVLAPATSIAEFCEQIRTELGTPLTIGGVKLALTAGIGVSAYPKDAQTAAELLRFADIAMYRAKTDLAPFCEYAEFMDEFTSDSLAIQAEFANAIRNEELTLVYQPKLRLDDLSMVGVEALSRWTHPTRGPIAPIRFLPLAENTELIHPFTELVLKNAVGQIARWLAKGFAVPVAVNISANNLLDQTFPDKLARLLECHKVPSSLLELEVTESAVMRYPEAMIKRLNEIRAIGVKLSIDDFGTGYTSLAYLKRLPVHTLKIDKVFVTNIDGDAADRRIARSAIQLAHGFGLNVVAEGVETQAVADLLLDDGCDQVQGYYFSRPVSPVEIESQWLQKLAVTTARVVA